MQPNDLIEIERVLSASRLSAYGLPGGDPVDRVANYLWNIALSDALYTILHALEIALRNGVHAAVAGILNDPDWLRSNSPVLLRREVLAVEKAENDLVQRGRNPDQGRLVAELMFGFWTGLFNRPYEQIFWQGGRAPLAAVFPHAPNSFLSRQVVHRRLNDIRVLRNRVFHYEPIWNRTGLATQHNAIVETIDWISPPLAVLSRRMDTFPAVHTAGWKALRAHII